MDFDAGGLPVFTEHNALVGAFAELTFANEATRFIVDSSTLDVQESGTYLMLSYDRSYVCRNITAEPRIWVPNGPNICPIKLDAAQIDYDGFQIDVKMPGLPCPNKL